MPPRLVHRLVNAIGGINQYLGHGRALESALVFVKFQYFLLLTVSPWPPFIIAFIDIRVPLWLLAMPFLVSAATSLVGLVMNARGYASSRVWRIVGATIGMACWIYMLVKNCMVGEPAAATNPWCVMGILASIWIIRRGALGLPPPGAPGAG